MKKIRTGSEKWVEAYLYDRWQQVRRHHKYLEFCIKHKDNFDNNKQLVGDSVTTEEAKQIRERFGLEEIYDFKLRYS